MAEARLRGDRQSKSEKAHEAVSTTPERDGLTEKQRTQLKAKSGKESIIQPETQPKNGRSKSTYHENVLSERERKPQFIGTAINVPFLVEEYLLIKEAFEAEDLKDAKTLTAYIRKVLLERAESALKPEDYERIANNKLNMVTEAVEKP
ncbi:hypothetical protein ACQUFW_00025 [Acinetobacter johnsonii]|uniref:hypothetical protein n=1 Tax=Acinetobacter johnsonii TaxID=40214 RepID=UPI003D184866